MCAVLNIVRRPRDPREDGWLEGEASPAGSLRCVPLADHDGDDATDREAFLARLATAAYQVALRHGIKGSFAKLQLDLWHELRAVCDRDDSMEGAGEWRR